MRSRILGESIRPPNRTFATIATATYREVVAEVEERLFGDGVDALQAGEVAHHAAVDVVRVGEDPELRAHLLEKVD
eukprot:1435133-Pyramimonas_sp.AAC.1